MQRKLDFHQIRDILISRGNRLNSGFGNNADDVKEFILKMTGLKTDTIVAELFQNFDGFVSGTVDGGSGIRIWTLNETLKSQSTNLTLTRITFADFLMGSEEITFDISNAENPVLYKDDGGKLADNVASFIQNMVSGQFDFL